MNTEDELRLEESSTATNQDRPFRVLGVALVVDQRGSGAKLVARYPTQSSESPQSTEQSSALPDDHHHANPKKELHSDDDLFFTLTARQMAKLFRTKKSLCGNPMTLAVNGTVFCCRAVLMQGDDGQEDPSQTAVSDSSSQPNQLVLFSVIVAMSAPMSHESVQFSTGSWFDAATEDQLDIQRYVKESMAAASISTPEAEHRNRKNTKGRVSSAFLSIRRVHISLARYCRVLEREERRCQYISLQSNHFFQIRNDHQKKWEAKKAASASLKASKQGPSSASSSTSVITAKSTQSSSERRPRHIRSASFGSNMMIGEDLHIPAQQQEFTIEEEQEKEQEILELMLASLPPKSNAGIPKHYGNLARELVQMFHSLSRNDFIYPSTPTSLLIERDGVVYVNQHIAIPVEAAALKPSHAVDNPTVRPYYTLLFPHASPSGLLQALQSSGSAPPQRLQQLLLTVNAQKPLTEIALDANLPLYTTLEMASYLVSHGACVMSPVVSRQSRLACNQVDRIPQLGLEFSQLFGSVHLFRVVAFLTSAKTLGAAMSLLTNLENGNGSWLRESLLSGRVRADLGNAFSFTSEELSPKGNVGQTAKVQELPSHWKEEMEEQLYAMAVWLISHRVLAQLQEYFVVVGIDHEDLAPVADESATPVVATISGGLPEADENLFRELLESDFLNGDISIMALAWRLGLDQQKVRSWGLRHRRIRVLSRIPQPGDDWDT
jgi:hypothetical protein